MSAWKNRAPSQVQIGNGSLLATFDEFGELEQVFAPNIDALQSRLGAFRTLIVFPSAPNANLTPGLAALVPSEFHAELKLHPGSQVLEVQYQHRHGPLRLKRTLGVHPTDPLILDSWEILEGPQVGLMHQTIPWIGGSTSAHCSLYHPIFNGLVHHRGRRWIGVIARSDIQWVRCGHLSDHDRHRLYDGDRIFAPVGGHELTGFPRGAVQHGWDQVVQGTATFGAIAIGPASRMDFFILFAESENHLGHLLDENRGIKADRFFQMSECMVKRRFAPANAQLDRIQNPRVRRLAERSIDVLHALQDRQTGALMAAAEVDPHSQLSGGYGYSWPRDGAYLVSALGAFGFRTRVDHYFQFLKDTQDPSGTWWQRYLATGHAGPSWGRIQIDEPATVIGAAYLHFKRTQDLFWLEKYWPTLEKGLSFLEEFHGQEHPMGQPSHDLWEERMGIHAYSLAAVAWAFQAGSWLARELSNTRLEKRYESWHRKILGLLNENFLFRDRPVRRSYIANTLAQMEHSSGSWDETPDVSLLGLVTPFGICGKSDPVTQKIVASIREKLWVGGVGGILRYPGDRYMGGNPWILTTLWLGMVELEMGNIPEARKCFEWAVSKATSNDFLAEQVSKESGKPCWVIPLAWSHAMLLLLIRQVLDQNAQDEIWGKT